MFFKNRREAGEKLAERLLFLKDQSDTTLFGLPRGGVMIAAEITKALSLPLSVIIARKIGSPHNEEYAIGALAETGETFWNENEFSLYDKRVLDRIVEKEKQEVSRRIQLYRQGRTLLEFDQMTVVLVDDGIATGYTMRAAISAVKHQHAKKIIVAVPHGAKETIDALRPTVENIICLHEFEFYGSVGQYYADFPQVSDQEVMEMLG